MKRIVVFFSGSASSLEYLLRNDPRRGEEYEIVGAFTDRYSSSGRKAVCAPNQIRCDCIDYQRWCKTMRVDPKDLKEREEYFGRVSRMTASFMPDIIMLSGFMLVITPPLLGAYHILNVHPADLRIVDDNGQRKYTGADAVTDAINAGESETFSTIHLLNEEIDGGPIITISDPLKYTGMTPKQHQECMKVMCDGPAYAKALEMITSGEYVLPSLS